MRRASLRFRLFAGGAASIIIALALASVGLTILFQQHVERRFVAELASDLRQLLSGLEPSEAGGVRVGRGPFEPAFEQPLSGRYWQVAVDGRVIARSRSLWDNELNLPQDRLADGETHQHTVTGPGGSSLLVFERQVQLPAALGGGAARAAVAVDRAEILRARADFARDLLPYTALLGAFLIAAAAVQVAIGLRPLDQIRTRVAQVRAGERDALGLDFPAEVTPLAAEVDLLLAAQEQAIDRARARASDLAHGLRTPLTVLQTDAAELRAKGEIQLGDEIADLADGMRRHVERELARARAGTRASARQPQPVQPVVEQVVSVVKKLPAAAGLDFTIEAPATLRLRMDPQDLTEVLGNLIENAAKWARGRILVRAAEEGQRVCLAVEDDGPGIADDARAAAMRRGGRLDEEKSGTGLGLAIVADILDNYEGSLSLERSSLGGLRAVVTI